MKQARAIPKAFLEPVSDSFKYFRPTVFIRKLEANQAVKRVLTKIKNVTIRFGGRILKVGKKLLEIVAYFLRRYPDTSVALLVMTVAGWLVGNIPVLGFLLKQAVVALAGFVVLLTFAKESVLVKKAQQTFGFLKDA